MQKQSIEKKDFQIIKQLGSGNYGTVHLVKRLEDEKLFALKSVRLSCMDLSQKNKALNEVRLLASIHSSYVVKYEGAFFEKNSLTLCILMEYANGGDLSTMVQHMQDQGEQSTGFDQKFIWKLCFALLQGLKMLHDNKIVHRDLKSANIFFSNGTPKIADLNVSKVINKELCSTQTGTPYYTCPEVWKGVQYNQKCDIWSLGVIIYELSTLTHPFRANQLPGLLRKIMRGVYQPIPNRFSPQLALFIANCLNIDPSLRPSASQLLSLQVFSEEKAIVQNGDQLECQVQLLESIKCPKLLSLLNKKLKKIDQDRLMRRRVSFSRDEQQQKKPEHIFRILKKKDSYKFKSQKCIGCVNVGLQTTDVLLPQMNQIRETTAMEFQKEITNKLPKLHFRKHTLHKAKENQPTTLKKLNYLRIRSMKKLLVETMDKQKNDQQQDQ